MKRAAQNKKTAKMPKLKKSQLPMLLLFSVYVLLLLSGLLPTEKYDSLTETFIAAIILQILVFAIPCLIYIYKKSNGDGFSYIFRLKINMFKAKDILFLLSLTMVAVFGGVLFNAMSFVVGLGSADFTSSASYILAKIPTNTNFIYVLTAFAAVPALFEEFLFRGILYREYENYNIAAVITVTSLAFAMSHFDLAHFFSYLLMGAVCAFAVYITSSVWSAVFIHFFINILNMYLLPALWNVITQPMGILFAIFVTVALLLVFLVLALNGAEKRFINMASTIYERIEDCDSITKEKKTYTQTVVKCVVSPGFLLCAFVFVIAAVINIFV